jgi:dTDP-4-amino-4,6-dideoxygalactose transaminase
MPTRISWIAKKAVNHDRTRNLLADSEKNNQFTNYGPNVIRLEKSIRDHLHVDDRKAVIAVGNASVGLWVAAVAFLLVSRGCEGDIIIPRFATQAFTFPPSAQGIMQHAVIVDIQPDDICGPSLDDLDACRDDIDGVVVTNVFGNLADIHMYETWCATHHKFLVFDNAATPLTMYQGKNSVNYGHAAVISFHHTKPIGFGEGGAVIIDAVYEATLRRLINFGIDNADPCPTWSLHGSNYKMSDISAAYILQHLDDLEDIVMRHRELYRTVEQGLNTSPELQNRVKLLPTLSDPGIVPFVSCFTLIVDSASDSDTVLQTLLADDVYCRKYYKPLAEKERSMSLYSKIVCVPCHRDMTTADVHRILRVIAESLRKK